MEGTRAHVSSVCSAAIKDGKHGLILLGPGLK